jgi:hypothetical protein
MSVLNSRSVPVDRSRCILIQAIGSPHDHPRSSCSPFSLIRVEPGAGRKERRTGGRRTDTRRLAIAIESGVSVDGHGQASDGGKAVLGQAFIENGRD